MGGRKDVHRAWRLSTAAISGRREVPQERQGGHVLPRPVLQQGQPTGADLVAVPPRLVELADRQVGVVTRCQLYTQGLARIQVDRAVAAGRWRAFGRTVIVLHNAALTAAQREWVAVLLSGKPTALAGLSGAAAAGLTGFEPEHVHIVVPHDTHVQAPAWVKLHESRRFGAADILFGGPPRTRPARSLIDGATWSRWPLRACAILCAGVQQRLVTSAQLEDELRVAGPVRHVAIMRDILGDIGGGGHTLAEIGLAKLALCAGLPMPRRQALRREPTGKVRYLDAEFDLPDGTEFVVEVDGFVHLKPVSWWNDMSRQNEIVIGGRPVLRFPSVTIRLEPAVVIDQLHRMLVAHAPR